MKRCFSFLLLLGALTGCYPIDTTSTTDKAWTVGSSASEPIYLSFKNSKKSPYYFLLRHTSASDIYELVVRWNSPDNDILFNGTRSTLKFFINNSEILSFNPVKQTTIISYNLETKGHQEEGIFHLSYRDLEKIAFAKKVETELTGKYTVVIGRFNRFHTFRAFRDFLNNSYL